MGGTESCLLKDPHTGVVLGPWKALTQYSLDLIFFSHQLIREAGRKATTVEAY